MRLRSGANRLAHDRDAEKSEHDRRNRGDEFDVGLDQTLLASGGDLAHVNGRGDSKRNGESERD